MGAVDSPKTNKENPLPSEATKILQSIASKWSDVADPNALQVIRLKGAMTNEVYRIKWPTKAGEMSRKVLVRIYGEGVDVFFNREDEIKTFECMSKHGQGPRLLGRFSTGRIEEFIRARQHVNEIEFDYLRSMEGKGSNGFGRGSRSCWIVLDPLRCWQNGR